MIGLRIVGAIMLLGLSAGPSAAKGCDSYVQAITRYQAGTAMLPKGFNENNVAFSNGDEATIFSRGSCVCRDRSIEGAPATLSCKVENECQVWSDNRCLVPRKKS